MTSRPALDLTRSQILAYRRSVQALDERLPPGPASLQHVAWAGLQDSMPRAALLSIHARVAGTGPSAWEDPSLVQVWGPRYSTYVIARRDIAVFTLGRLPEDGANRRFAEGLAARLHAFLDGRTMSYSEAGHGLGVNPNALRYAAPTGTVLIRWEGARRPTIWTIPAPDVDPTTARLELARRHLHVFGPTTPGAFAQWAGIRPRRGVATFEGLGGDLTPVRTPVGDGFILALDEPAFRASPGPAAPARLLPSGDTYYLLQDADRELLVPERGRRPLLWTSRVWPGALFVRGEIAGTWRRANADLTVEPWRDLTAAEREAVETEAHSLPLPGIPRIQVRWGG